MQTPIVTRDLLGLHHEHMTAHPPGTQRLIEDTVPGQASWGVRELDRTCRECAFWLCNPRKPARNAVGELMPQLCRQAATAFRSRKIEKVPHNAIACRHFQPRIDPPAATVR